MADQNFRVDTGLDVGIGGTIITTTGIGSIGIATTNPTQTLDISGGLRVRGGLYDVNNSSGLLNQVVVANGAGGWAWQAPAGGGAGAAIQIDGGSPISIYTSTPVIDAEGP